VTRDVIGGVAASLVLLTLSAAGCGDDSSSTEPDGPCESALSRVGGISIVRDCVEVASWNHEEDGLATGVLDLTQGEDAEVEIRFLDHALDRELFTNRPGTITLDPSCTALSWVATPAAPGPSGAEVSVESVPDEPWCLRVTGTTEGMATLRLTARSGDRTYSTGAMDVLVRGASLPDPAELDFAVVLNGIRKLLVVDGALTPSCGTVVADPGYLEARVGEITEGHYSFRYLDGCTARTYDEDTHRLLFEFRDPCVAGVVNHPEHFGVNVTFHLEGLAAGETDVRLRLYEGNEHRYTSPWLPVVVVE